MGGSNQSLPSLQRRNTSWLNDSSEMRTLRGLAFLLAIGGAFAGGNSAWQTPDQHHQNTLATGGAFAGGNSAWQTPDQHHQNTLEASLQEFERTAPRGNEQGCWHRNLSFMCLVGNGTYGSTIINRCQFYDGSNNSQCHLVFGETVGYNCGVCCKVDNAIVPKCDLKFVLPEFVPNSRTRRDCRGKARGSKCNANGHCEEYCCLETSKRPCRTPLCPTADNKFENNKDVDNQCRLWRRQGRNRRDLARQSCRDGRQCLVWDDLRNRGQTQATPERPRCRSGYALRQADGKCCSTWDRAYGYSCYQPGQ